MNTNKDSSQYTKQQKTRSISAYYAQFASTLNSGLLIRGPVGVSNLDSSIEPDIVMGNLYYQAVPLPISTVTTTIGPVVTLIYAYFLTSGSSTWAAPATVTSPITYWLVGGGGGGGGAYDFGIGGGGGGGSVVTGTYAVTRGTSYTVIVGAGGAGGTGNSGTSTETNGAAGIATSFNAGGGGPSAFGGGGGYAARNFPGGLSAGGAAATAGSASVGGSGNNAVTPTQAGGAGGGSTGAGGTSSTSAIGLGGAGTSLAFPGINSGNAKTYGNGTRGLPSFGPGNDGDNGAANTGDGAQSGAATLVGGQNGGTGGSGLVVLRYYA